VASRAAADGEFAEMQGLEPDEPLRDQRDHHRHRDADRA